MHHYPELQSTTGIEFHDLALLREALIHRSCLNEGAEDPRVSNERLEFLGDAVLGFVVAGRLYHKFPNMQEGQLTQLRSILVCRSTLAEIGRRLELGKYLFLGHGEERSGGRSRESNLAGTLEAVIGAVFLDQGIDRARELVLGLLEKELAAVEMQPVAKDAKSALQEMVQSLDKPAPAYRLASSSGPDHEKSFLMEVLVDGKIVGKGAGRSKRRAQMAAAQDALQKLQDALNR